MPLYSFQHYSKSGSGNGFDFAIAETDELALLRAESQMRWQCSHSVEVFHGDTLVAALTRSSGHGSPALDDLYARVERVCVGTNSADLAVQPVRSGS